MNALFFFKLTGPSVCTVVIDGDDREFLTDEQSKLHKTFVVSPLDNFNLILVFFNSAHGVTMTAACSSCSVIVGYPSSWLTASSVALIHELPLRQLAHC